MKDGRTFGLNPIKKDKIYSDYIGKYVRLNSNGNTFYGKLIKSNYSDFTELKPSLVDYSTPKINKYRLETKISTKIITDTITVMQPVTKKLLEDICKDMKLTNEKDE